MKIKYPYIPSVSFNFFGLQFPEGDLLIDRLGNGYYDFYTRSDGCNDIVFQFGCKLASDFEALDCAIGNYECDNIDWQE